MGLYTPELEKLNSSWKYSTMNITDASFSPMGNALAVGNLNGDVLIFYDLKTFKSKRFKFNRGPTSGGVLAVNWLDETTMIVLGDDKCVKFYTVPDSA